MDTKKAASNYFEAQYLKKHPKKFDAQRAAMLKLLQKRKKQNAKKASSAKK